MFFQCTYCNISSKSKDDSLFVDCKEKKHQIVSMLESKEIKYAAKGLGTTKVKSQRKKVKGIIDKLYVESIIVEDKPYFLCVAVENGILSTKETVETDDTIYKPLHPEQCGYFPYEFTSSKIVSINDKISKDDLFDDIKTQIDRFVSLRDLDKFLILGNIFLTYCLEWISTVHYPFFVGETESGKSTVLHLVKWLGYRCHLGEDIPSADIYNFFGTDEEGTGTIAEDEAQELSRSFEKLRMYKSGYSKGSLKARIVGVDSLGKHQVFYKTFGPKWFAGERIPQDKGFNERLAIIHMTEGQPKSNIKRLSPEERVQLTNLRNALLVWKVQNISKGLEKIESGLTQRDQELWEDFLSISCDTKYFDKFKNVVNYYTEQRHNAIKTSLEAKLFKFVLHKLDENLELKFEDYWNYLTVDNPEFTGKMDERSNKTFYAAEYSEKITQYTISKIFDNKFQAIKHVKVARDQDKVQHQTTVYKFDKAVATTLAKKYSIEVPLDNPLYVSPHSQQGQQTDDHVNHVNQVSKEALK